MNLKHQERTKRIVTIYNDSGLNQRQFSELIGVSQQLISAVINNKKKPNESILFGIIDNIKEIDPIWLITGIGKYKNNIVLETEKLNTLENQIQNIVEKQFEKLSIELNQKISNIEEYVKKSNVKNVLRRIDQDNSKLVPQLNKKKSSKLRG